MTVSVVIPWRGGCQHRGHALAWVLNRYAWHHPDWVVVIGHSPNGPFSRAAAIIDGASRADSDVVVVADGDVWCDGLAAAVDHAATGWAVPHQLIHRLSPESTDLVLHGADWRGLPLSTDNKQDAKPYLGNETGTLVALNRDVLLEVPPDRRFTGWGQEDRAWATALHTLVGDSWRGPADLVHLWHPPQERRSRVIGNDSNLALLRRYQTARSNSTAMRALIDEAA